MRKTTTAPAIRPRKRNRTEKAGDEVLATFGHNPRKAIPFATMLFVLITVGVFGIAQTGIRQGWGMALLLIGLPGILAVAFVRDRLLKGPLLIATQRGLIDRRRGPDTIAWEDIAEATAKNRLFAKGVRLVLTDGDRIEIDLSLLDAEPKDILHLIHSAAGHE